MMWTLVALGEQWPQDPGGREHDVSFVLTPANVVAPIDVIMTVV